MNARTLAPASKVLLVEAALEECEKIAAWEGQHPYGEGMREVIARVRAALAGGEGEG